MKPASSRPLLLFAFIACLLAPSAGRAQDASPSPTPDAKALKEARKAAEQEEKAQRAAAEKERKEAEAAAKKRGKAPKEAAPAPSVDPGSAEAVDPMQGLSEKERKEARKAEERAAAEAEKARKKEEERAKAEEAKRRKDEERAEREAAKAREKEEREIAAAQKKDAASSKRRDRDAEKDENSPADENRPKSDDQDRKTSDEDRKSSDAKTRAKAEGTEEGEAAAPRPSKEDEKKRRDLVRQIEKARAERDRLNTRAEEAEVLAKAARTAANDAQRTYEALATGLEVEDVAAPAAPSEAAPKRNRFQTKASVAQAAAPQTAADPLRLALDLKKPTPEEREAAAFALASLGPDAQPATRALMAALADTSAAVRIAAAQALGRIGAGASIALPPLQAALTDPDPAVKNAAQAALLSIQGR